MKKIILVVAVLFSLSSVFTSCREEKKADEQIEETIDEVGDDVEDAAEDVGDEVEDAFDGN